MLIPFSCNTEIPLEGVSGQHAIKIEFVDAIKREWVHGEKRRVYSPSIYKATKSGEEVTSLKGKIGDFRGSNLRFKPLAKNIKVLFITLIQP